MSLTRASANRPGRTVGAALAAVVALVLVSGSSCTGDDPRKAQPGPVEGVEPAPNVNADGEPITVDVAPDQPLAVAVAGLGRLVAPSGAFTSSGRIVVRKLRSDTPDGSFVVADGPGIDVSIQGTQVASPITILFDDPATAKLLPKNALPVVLHKPDGGQWEAKPVSFTPDGVPYLMTTEFSPNLFGWIRIPDWIRNIGDSLADYATQRTDPRGCANNAPNWSSVDKRTTLVHLCTITNVEPGSGVPRTEIQVQSNRRFFQWVSVPPGNDYLWTGAIQPDWLRRIIGNRTHHDPDREVLLPGNGWFTAGYRQPAQQEAKQFNAYLDHWSMAFSIGTNILDLDPRDPPAFSGAAFIIVKCVGEFSLKPNWDDVKDFVKCVITEALSNLDVPGRAFRSALDMYGESGYAKAAEEQLRKSTQRLKWLGKAMRIIGVAGLIQTVYWQLPDAFSGMGNDHPGRFTLNLKPRPPTPPTTQKPPTTQPPPTQPPPPTHPPPTQPPPLNPRIELSQGGTAPAGWWYAVTLSGFAPGSSVTVTCRDSVDPGGFWNQTFVIGGDGRAGDSTLCYSGDGPDHWVTGGGVESNHVPW